MGREATLYLTSRGVRVTGIDAWGWDAPFVHTRKRWLETHDPVDHLGRPQSRPRDSLLPHGEAAKSRTASRARLHRRLLPAQDQSRLRRLDAGGGAVRLAAASFSFVLRQVGDEEFLFTPTLARSFSPRAGRSEITRSRSRDAPSHPSFASRFKKALRASLFSRMIFSENRNGTFRDHAKRREAERRQAHHGFRPAAERKACQRMRRALCSPLPRIGAGLKEAARSPFGAPPRSCAEGP